jgi:hypothetical protein
VIVLLLLSACATQQDVSLVRQTESAATQIQNGYTRPSSVLSLSVLAGKLVDRLTQPTAQPKGQVYRPVP